MNTLTSIRQGTWFVIISCIMACAGGIVAMLFYEFEVLRAWLHHTLFIALPGYTGLSVLGLSMCVILPLVMMLQTKYFIGASGTGIPQAIAAVWAGDGNVRGRLLSMKIALGKILLLFLVIISGATVGREGPSVHVAACFMMMVPYMAQTPPWLEKRGLIIAGGGAGIAAAFNAPIAGIIFAFEEIASALDKQNLSCVIRTVVLASLMGVLWLGNYLFFGRIATEFSWTYGWVLVVVGVIGGAAGGFFARMVVTTIQALHKSMSTRYVFWGVIFGVILTALLLLSDGLTIGSGYPEAQSILLGHTVPWWYPYLKAVASYVSLISLVPGGLFDPALAVGASLGSQLHGFIVLWDPAISARLIILLCMIAYFAGVVQSPITCCVIVLEMTGQYELALPCALTSAIAFSVSRLICKKAIYQELATIILFGHQVDSESQVAKIRYDRSVE